jgi:hypothetical protein
MRITSGIGIAWRSMSRNRLRTFFMMAGVMIGICSLTILDSMGENTKRETMKRFKNMIGTFDTVIIRPGAGKTRGMVSLTNVPPTLKFEDAAAVAGELPEVKQVAMLQNAFDIDVKYKDKNASPAIFGVSANWLDLRGDEVAQGNFISEEDMQSLARVAILGSDVLPVLFPEGDAIGKTIRIGDVPFQVKGVLASRGAGPGGGSLDNLILIPVTTASKRLFNRDFLTMLIAQVREPDKSDEDYSTAEAASSHRDLCARRLHAYKSASGDGASDADGFYSLDDIEGDCDDRDVYRRGGDHELDADQCFREKKRDWAAALGRSEPAGHFVAVYFGGFAGFEHGWAHRNCAWPRRNKFGGETAAPSAHPCFASLGMDSGTLRGTGFDLRHLSGVESDASGSCESFANLTPVCLRLPETSCATAKHFY